MVQDVATYLKKKNYVNQKSKKYFRLAFAHNQILQRDAPIFFSENELMKEVRVCFENSNSNS